MRKRFSHLTGLLLVAVLSSFIFMLALEGEVRAQQSTNTAMLSGFV